MRTETSFQCLVRSAAHRERERGTWIVNSSFIYAGEADRAEILYRAELCNRRADVQATSGDTLKKMSLIVTWFLNSHPLMSLTGNWGGVDRLVLPGH